MAQGLLDINLVILQPSCSNFGLSQARHSMLMYWDNLASFVMFQSRLREQPQQCGAQLLLIFTRKFQKAVHPLAFCQNGLKKMTIYPVMQRVDAGKSFERWKGQGCPCALSKSTEWKVKLAVNNKDDGSIVTLAQALICIFPFSGCQHIIFFRIFLFLLTNHTCML